MTEIYPQLLAAALSALQALNRRSIINIAIVTESSATGLTYGSVYGYMKML